MLTIRDILQPENVSYTDNVWTWAVAHMLHKGEDWQITTITDTAPIEIVFLSKGEPLTDFIISGDTLQDGTPTPSAPVDVVGCGERTGNLFDGFDYYGVVPSINNGSNANYHAGASTDYIKVDNPLITLSKDQSFRNARIYIFLYDDNKTFIGYAESNETEITSQIISNYTSAKFARIRVDAYYQYAEQYMLNYGSTAPPYEPYGYKLSLTVNGTEYPIYLGQVPTTRRIRKLVLTGEETGWEDATFGGNHFFMSPILSGGAAIYIGIPSTHYVPSNVGDAQRPDDSIRQVVYATTYSQLSVRDDACTTLNDFKSYLAAQYAAGTPVTVWYVLAEPETGIVNEPLMKIGEYADTISMVQAGVTIPTVAGTNTLTVGTTVQPSVVSITGNIKEVQGNERN